MPVKDFDAEWADRDRSFTMHGETFTRREAVSMKTLLRIDEPTPVGDEQIVESEKTHFLRLIEDEDRERFLALCEREEKPLGLGQLREVLAWLVREHASGFPTTAPVSSGNGRAKTGTGSRARSSSTVGAG